MSTGSYRPMVSPTLEYCRGTLPWWAQPVLPIEPPSVMVTDKVRFPLLRSFCFCTFFRLKGAFSSFANGLSTVSGLSMHSVHRAASFCVLSRTLASFVFFFITQACSQTVGQPSMLGTD
jgi:hypothetical protein